MLGSGSDAIPVNTMNNTSSAVIGYSGAVVGLSSSLESLALGGSDVGTSLLILNQ